MPSKQEKEEHEATGHACYRSWCEHCVAAKARGQYHRGTGEQGELPEIALDYGHMSRNDEKCMPIICARHREYRHHAATYVKSKGRNDYAVRFLVAWVRGLGHKRIVCRSDNERSLLALLQKVSACMPEVEIIPKTSPEGDHSANGLAEIRVREIKAQIRVIRSQVESSLKSRLDEDEPILAWIPRHAANCMNRYRIMDDGRTPEQRRVGKRWKRAAVAFREKVFYRPVAKSGGAKNDAEMRMRPRIFVGHYERTGTHILITPNGVERGIGLHPLPEDSRWDAEFLRTCKGLPWELKPGRRTTSQPTF